MNALICGYAGNHPAHRYSPNGVMATICPGVVDPDRKPCPSCQATGVAYDQMTCLPCLGKGSVKRPR